MAFEQYIMNISFFKWHRKALTKYWYSGKGMLASYTNHIFSCVWVSNMDIRIYLYDEAVSESWANSSTPAAFSDNEPGLYGCKNEWITALESWSSPERFALIQDLLLSLSLSFPESRGDMLFSFPAPGIITVSGNGSVGHLGLLHAKRKEINVNTLKKTAQR